MAKEISQQNCKNVDTLIVQASTDILEENNNIIVIRQVVDLLAFIYFP